MKLKGLNLPTDTQIEFPFYGDRLDEFAKQFDIPLSEDIIKKGGDVDTEYLEYLGEMLDALRIKAGVTDEQIHLEYGDKPQEMGFQNHEWVLAMARVLDKTTFIGGIILDNFLRDVFLYIKHAGVRDEINKIVNDKSEDYRNYHSYSYDYCCFAL